MTATLTLPDTGVKVRTQSQRRFVLVWNATTDHPFIGRRSDSLDKMRALRASKGGVLFDTTTGEVVPR